MIYSEDMDTDVDKQFYALLGYCRELDSVYENERDFGVVDSDGKSALHIAVEENNKNYVDNLLSHGLDANFKDNDCRTPLHYAALSLDLQIAQLLLNHGSDPNFKDDDGLTPLSLHLKTLSDNASIRKEDLKLIETFFHHGADPDIRDDDHGWTPLIYALSTNNESVIRLVKKASEVSYTCNRDDQGRLHSIKYPAIKTDDGIRVYAIEGEIVDRKVVEAPEELTLNEILFERRQKARRIKIEQYGKKEFIQDIATEIVDQKNETILYRTAKPSLHEQVAFLKVLDATPRKDGTRPEYYLRVPPSVQTINEALAWTFGKEPDEYNPEVET